MMRALVSFVLLFALVTLRHSPRRGGRSRRRRPSRHSRSRTAFRSSCSPPSRCSSTPPPSTSITRAASGSREAVNYRRKNFGRPIIRKEGDRIVVLVDDNARRQGGRGDDVLPGAGDRRAARRVRRALPRRQGAEGVRLPVARHPRVRGQGRRPEGRRPAEEVPHRLSAASTTTTASTASTSARTASCTSPWATAGVGGLQSARRQGEEVDDQRHRLPEGNGLALRHGRHEPRTDRPQLPQQLRVLRQQLRRGVALGQRRRRQPADADLLRDARRQLRLRPARPRPDALARGAAGHRPQDAPHRLRQPDRHHLLRRRDVRQEVHAARSCTATPARARCAGSTSSRRARATSSKRKCCSPAPTTGSGRRTCAWPRTAASSWPTGTTAASAATAWATRPTAASTASRRRGTRGTRCRR